MSSPARTAKAAAQEPQIEKQSYEVNVGSAAQLLELEPEEVLRLCKAGTLLARRNSHGSWRIDEAFLIRWREENPNSGAAGCESNEEQEEEEQRALARLAARAPVPAGACEGHWERRGEIVPAFRVGLCRRCFSGRPLSFERRKETRFVKYCYGVGGPARRMRTRTTDPRPRSR